MKSENALVEDAEPIEGVAEAGGVGGIQTDTEVGIVDLFDEIAEFQGG